MRRYLIIILLLTGVFTCCCQEYKTWQDIQQKLNKLENNSQLNIQELTAALKEAFQTPEDQYKGLFYWVTHHIDYDVANMKSADLYSSSEDAANQTLLKRKALCQGYVEFTHAVCELLNIKSIIVAGYTRQQGHLDPLPHSWLIMRLMGQWYISDPTWASGYVKDQQYVDLFNPFWYLCESKRAIQSHMPFDPLWQLTSQPARYSDFDSNDSIVFSNGDATQFNDSIAFYDKQKRIDQIGSILRRMAANGKENELIRSRKEHMLEEKEVLEQNEVINSFNEAVALFNKGVTDFNQYIHYKNKRFLPERTEKELRGMTDTALTRISLAASKLNGLVSNNPTLNDTIEKLNRDVDASLKRVKEEVKFVSRYFQTPPGQRKRLFLK